MNLRDRSGIKRKSSFSYEIKDVQLPEEKVAKKQAEKRKKKRRRTPNKIWSLEEKKMMLDGILIHLKIKRHFHMKKNLPEIQQFIKMRRQFSSQIEESHLHDWFSLNKILVDQVADYSVCLAQQFSKAVGWPAEDSKSQLDSSLNNDNNISINNINDRDNINSSGNLRSSSNNNNNIDNLDKLNIVQNAFNTGDKNATFIIKITNNPNTANNVNNISKNIKNSNCNRINKAYASNTDINNKNINSKKNLDSSTIWSNVYRYISATLNNTPPPELNQIESAIVLLLLENLLKNYQTLNIEHQMDVIRSKFNCLAPLLSLSSLSLPPHQSKSLSRSEASSSSTSGSVTRDAVENVLVKALC
ncbi:hypothetical protein HELRODRAFT_167082 [Helobdella robusta]|uniref:Uncharacterized protein n=1 Tax=Helobdella robusta TaxID=6412 RepID=T1EZ01_HELRO|nr:hypothetical protein HELRODRAFT_167082 [Helobdella robusta]ESO10580.1 hypothetical protein HELRODRAFT_167082 [Helobdella robusta]